MNLFYTVDFFGGLLSMIVDAYLFKCPEARIGKVPSREDIVKIYDMSSVNCPFQVNYIWV